jgi:hypothetical protein
LAWGGSPGQGLDRVAMSGNAVAESLKSMQFETTRPTGSHRFLFDSYQTGRRPNGAVARTIQR